jgi:two-component system, LytTR family, response regulator
MNPAPLTCIIVDDEQYAINVLVRFINETPALKLLQTFTSSPAALSWVMDNPVDIVFLDISMPKLNGLEFAKTIQGRAHIILCTAHAEYGAESYNHNVADYLLKPVEYPRFLQAIQKIKENIQAKQAPPDFFSPDFILVPAEGRGRMLKINYEDIYYIAAAKNYLHLHTRNGLVRTLMPMKEAEQKLPVNRFLRVHHSYIVSVSKIKHLDQYAISLHNHAETIPIGAAYRAAVLKKLQHK